jgi:hypothetical protein
MAIKDCAGDGRLLCDAVRIVLEVGADRVSVRRGDWEASDDESVTMSIAPSELGEETSCRPGLGEADSIMEGEEARSLLGALDSSGGALATDEIEEETSVEDDCKLEAVSDVG